ncbi:MAG: replication-associated recombination protein A, partial [Candidatus Moraniibacteriota bacterium]
IEGDTLPSLIFWGPPGSGKTTLARLIASETAAHFVSLSAVTSGKKDLQLILEQAEAARRLGERTILFVDEIHRWNKAQQDALLPQVENGTLTFIGATTENPSFEVNAALLSRTRVLVFTKHSEATIVALLVTALEEDEALKKKKVTITQEALAFIAAITAGDARAAYQLLEAASELGKRITPKVVGEIAERSHLLYDKGGEEHYNLISALHKSMRGGDADASLYYLARMLEAGEDPLYVARRLVRFASEDIGVANSLALPQAVAAFEAARMLGMPECEVHLAQAVVYMALSKKSNALYTAYGKAKQDVHDFPNEPVPLHLRNAPTKLMKNIGYSKGYKYTPDYKNKKEAEQEYFPKKLKGRKYLTMH